MFRSNILALVCSVAIGAGSLCAQEAQEASHASPAPATVTLTADGQLVGNAFAQIDGEEKPVEAKITLTQNGVVVGSKYANEDGSFAFPSVKPGIYNMYGSAATFVGGKTLKVLPTATTAPAPVALPMATFTPTSYAAMAAAPAAQACGCGCNTCLLYTSPSPRDATLSRMPSSA